MSEHKTIVGLPEHGNLRVARVNGELWFVNADLCRILKRQSLKPYIDPKKAPHASHVCNMKFPTAKGYQQPLRALDEAAVRYLIAKIGPEKQKEKSALELMVQEAVKAFEESSSPCEKADSPVSVASVEPTDSMVNIIFECEKLDRIDRDKIYTFILGYKAGMAGRIEIQKEENHK